MLASGAAVWFLGLMGIADEKICPWCLVVHASGLFSSGLVVAAFLRRPKSAVGPHGHLPLASLGGLAAAALGGLILGQFLGSRPQTHRVEPLSGEARAEFRWPMRQETRAGGRPQRPMPKRLNRSGLFP